MTKEYGYTNSYDEYVVVTQDHIDTAVKIYQELSKASHSKKISWRRHKAMMEREGYDDSDVNENYRQLIKRNRKAKGVLPEVEKYAEMVSEGTIQSVREEIGLIQSSKLEASDEFTRLSKIKRDLNRDLLFIEAISKGIAESTLTEYHMPEFTPMVDSDEEEKDMLITLNDIHYGYEVDKYYNTEIAKQVVNDYADEVIKLGLRENVSKIIIANGGDNVEGRLRRQSLVDSSLSHIEQIVEVSHIIIAFIEKLSRYFKIEIFFLIGNHERLSESYKEALENESLIPVIESMVESTFKDNKNIKLTKPLSPYHHIANIRGYHIFVCHGDRHKVKDPNLLYKLSVNYDTLLDIVLAGHFHSFSTVEVGKNKYQIISGAIKGVDSFSEKINSQSSRSQVAILFDDNGFDIRQIGLN